jgi:RecG-like helicase
MGLFKKKKKADAEDDMWSALSKHIDQMTQQTNFEYDSAWPIEKRLKAIHEYNDETNRKNQLYEIAKSDSDSDVRMAALKKAVEYAASSESLIEVAAIDIDPNIRKYSLKQAAIARKSEIKIATAFLEAAGFSPTAAQSKVRSDFLEQEGKIKKLLQDSPYTDVRNFQGFSF